MSAYDDVTKWKLLSGLLTLCVENSPASDADFEVSWCGSYVKVAGRLSLCYATLHWHDNGTAGLARASGKAVKQKVKWPVIWDYMPFMCVIVMHSDSKWCHTE